MSNTKSSKTKGNSSTDITKMLKKTETSKSKKLTTKQIVELVKSRVEEFNFEELGAINDAVSFRMWDDDFGQIEDESLYLESDLDLVGFDDDLDVDDDCINEIKRRYNRE
jgi:hypothetical protein